ncbi:aryl hydrocarbon receptor nuclear translocator-like protein 2 isoform X3 [Ischnura elegans]|uniref:aryl hydrocarbon receptor nuclear translocator-like protein 2 isoform X3 n=1 Tax=Ischnura elegans TaxID=197161 RepID=UPI001ED892A0|nr:aryl hydrocarbon receptor nuclear translocator-like protein 2 isoform X3 [Ischnura elegans]
MAVVEGAAKKEKDAEEEGGGTGAQEEAGASGGGEDEECSRGGEEGGVEAAAMTAKSEEEATEDEEAEGVEATASSSSAPTSASPAASSAAGPSSAPAADEAVSPASSVGSSAAAAPSSTAALVAKQMPSSSRVMRNLAEKMRRDKLNTYISELATLVPWVSSSPRRLDKTSILRLSANYLRMHKTLPISHGSLNPFLPDPLKSFNLSEKILEDMEGFLFVVMGSGKIVFVSHAVEKLLGHTQNDLLGQSMYGITHADDHKLLAKNLSLDAEAGDDAEPPNCDELGIMAKFCSGSSMDVPMESHHHQMLQGDLQEAGGSSSSSTNGDGANSKRLSFYVRLSQRAVGRGETAGYEVVHIVGQLRSTSSEDGPSTSSVELNHSGSSSSSSSSGEAVMVAVARICRERQILELSLMEACKDEYLTRHGIRGEILNVDHRISVVAGYMADEVKGQSAFSFMHDQDARWTFIALQKMFSSSDGCGNSCYRLKSKTGQFIYLRTQGYCEFDRVTGKFDTFVCINTLVSEEEGKKAVEEMRQRYSASIADRGMVSHAIMDAGPSRALDAPMSKGVCTPSPNQPMPGPSHDISMSPVSSLPSTSASLGLPSPGRAIKQNPLSPEICSAEAVGYDVSEENIVAPTPKSCYMSTGASPQPLMPLTNCHLSSPPPPLIPILQTNSIPCSTMSPQPPPYIFDGAVPPIEAPPHPSLSYVSPPKDITRGPERQFSPREGTWGVRAQQSINPLKRPFSCTSPPMRPSKRHHHRGPHKTLEPLAPTSHQNPVCPRLDYLPLVDPNPPRGELRDVDPVRPVREVASECGRTGKFPEDDRRLSSWVGDDDRPASLDLLNLDRNTDFPDLRDDVEQLDMFSMQVGPELVDPRRWDLSGESQPQELDGSIALPNNIGGVEDPAVEETIHGGIRRSHRRLRLRLDSQGCTMASIERNLAGLTGGHVIEGDLARLRVERKKQMHMLHTLEQEHRSSIPTQDKTKAYGMQNVGV